MNFYVLAIASLLVFIINIPFGYWRSNTRKFSFPWFLAIHLPIPLIVLLRVKMEIGFIWYTYPIFIGTFFLGQRLGYIFNNQRKAATAKT